ncbi:Zinc finger BED domain-containing protein RICESLEEPER 2-like [Heracleum sosnowskyi]|uniref:Zinc finger BED domain-containing protein RICESLEEPER 2-like n=1 Tax=Heracleum sosnowskyi TaxID=360622 RepID=A0AAD8I6E1_9APIA|nr:Zinc finger BED domain-containing protein RICESLEEPER 2-like [Heracleum sosnowskyi]
MKGMTLESSQISSSDKNYCVYEETLIGMSEYEAFIHDSGAALEPTKSELDDYLSSFFLINESSVKTIDALSWWKRNSAKYPILSRMARDSLVVPLSTVASETTFSAGSRVIEPHRSSLKTETVEMLLLLETTMDSL